MRSPTRLAPMSQQTEPLLIDVDTGIDDAFALLYACASREAEIVGVTTVVGNVSLASATRNTRAVLRLAGRGDIPVSPGAASSLSEASGDARHVHGESGLGHAVLPEPPEPAARMHAVDAICAAAHAHSGRLAGRIAWINMEMRATGGPSRKMGTRLLTKYQPRFVAQPLWSSLAGRTAKKCSRGANTATSSTSQTQGRTACSR
jgi:hypothetical protein